MRFPGKAIGAVGCLLAVMAIAGCGEAAVGTGHRSATAKTSGVGDPPGGATGPTDATGATANPADGAGDPPRGKTGTTAPSAGAKTDSPGSEGTKSASGADAKGAHTIEVADPEEAKSFPAPASVRHSAAATPAKSGEVAIAAGAPSTAEVQHELKQMQAVEHAARRSQQQRLTPVTGGESIGGNGTIPIPPDVPEVVQRVIAGANAIADFPYVFGGGHGSFVDNAYDCSGSVSYALAAGGLLSAPEVSGDLETWGVPGPGKYITVYANAGHTYMYIDGMLYDTAGRSGVYASRWLVGATDNSGYVARHWPGL
jgi:cell wall-associated NlpC family hydrolase